MDEDWRRDFDVPHYKTGSGQAKLVFFSNELADALSREAASSGKFPSWIVRQALLEYLGRKGYLFTPFANPEGRGVRSDLRKGSASRAEPTSRRAEVLAEAFDSEPRRKRGRGAA